MAWEEEELVAEVMAAAGNEEEREVAEVVVMVRVVEVAVVDLQDSALFNSSAVSVS